MLIKELEKRLKVFSIIAVVIISLLVIRLGYLQLLRGAEYKDLAMSNRIRIIPQVAPRGPVYDRNEELLIGNRPAFSLSIMQPASREDFEDTITKLSEILEVPREELVERMQQQQRRRFEPIKIRTDIDLETVTKIEEQRAHLTGVIIETEPIRYYPNGDFATHILGYVGEINARELERMRERELDYRIGDTIGKMGIEQILDNELKGVRGGRRVEVDAKANLISVQGEVVPIPGQEARLTIDVNIQRAAEDGFKETMERVKTSYPNAKSGAVVAMDVRTGEILASVSEPGFDPNLFAGRISSEELSMINNNPLKPYNNRVISSAYPPGSIFKMVTGAAALRNEKIKPNEYYYCSGVYWVGNHPFRCWLRTGHGRLDFVGGIKHSCNIVFYEAAMRAGIDEVAVMAREFGLGERTGIILPGEVQGIVPDTRWKAEAYEKGITRYATWFRGDTANAAIGQGDHLYTPIQLVRMTAAIANGGQVLEPQLIYSITSPEGEEVFHVEPKIVKTVDLEEKYFDLIRQGMKLVTQPGGTAAGAFRGFPVSVAGKTGTAQNAHGDNHGWFAGYAPADNPQVAVVVLVEQGGSGSGAAAPVARRVFEAAFGMEPGQAELPINLNAVE